MKKKLFLLMLILSLNACSEMYLEEITYTFNSGCQYYRLYTDIDTVLVDPGIDYYTPKYGQIINGVWELQEKEVVYRDNPVYNTVCSMVSDNKSSEKEVCTVSNEVLEVDVLTEEKVIYTPEISGKEFYKGEKKIIRFCADFIRQYIPGRGWVIEVDVVPNYAGKSYPQFAWFNSTYTQKIDLINDSYNLPTPVNGSAGCNGTHYFTRNTGTGNLSTYLNSCSDLAYVSDDSTAMPLDIESPGLNYSVNTLYSDAWYVNHFGFNESGNSSYNSVLQAYDSEYYIRRNVSTGLIGQGWASDGASAIFIKNSTNTQYSLGDSFSIFTCAKPYNSTQWSSDASGGCAYWLKAPNNCYLYLDYVSINNYAWECGGFQAGKAITGMSSQWYCFTLTCDGTMCYGYLNDTLTTTFAYSRAEFLLSNFNIGVRKQVVGGTIDQILEGAKIDEFNVYTRNLSQADVSHLTRAYLKNSEYMYSSLTEFPVNPVVSILSIDGKTNDSTTLDSTPDVLFNVSAEKTLYSCDLYVNGSGKGSNTTVLNNSNTVLTVNSSLSGGGYYFNITCSGSLTNSSVWFMTVETTTTTTTTNAGTSTTSTTLCNGLYNLSYYGSKQLCVKNITNGETCLNNTDAYEYNCSQDYVLTLKTLRYSNTVRDVFTVDLPDIIYMVGFTLILILILSYVIWGVIL